MTILVSLTLAAHCYCQPPITIKGYYTPLEFFDEVFEKTGFLTDYSKEDILDNTKVWIDLHNASLEAAYTAALAGLGLHAKINRRDKVVRVTRTEEMDTFFICPFVGRVVNTDSIPVADADIWVEELKKVVRTDKDGCFTFRGPARMVHVRVSFPGHIPLPVELYNTASAYILLVARNNNMDQAVVQPYGITTQRFITGSITTTPIPSTGPEPFINPLDFLQSRVPGLDIRRPNGTPGSGYNVLIRGLNSISQGRDPLILIDGVPIAGYNSYLSRIGSMSAQGALGASVLNSIDLSNILSIEVFKDAQATAIYGSRGANGVINITLRKGAAGKLKCTYNGYYGFSRAPLMGKLLNTQQYLQLRAEALRNDGMPVNDATLPEQTWGSLRDVDYRKVATGNTGVLRASRLHVTWGDARSSLLLTGHYNSESSVFSKPTKDQHFSFYGNFRHQSGDGKWHFDLAELASKEDNLLPVLDPSIFGITAAPNMPSPYDAAGLPRWQSDSQHYFNIPESQLYRYQGSVVNLYHHLQLSYRTNFGVLFKSSIGLNTVNSHETTLQPIEAQDPDTDPRASGVQTTNKYSSMVMDFTPEYSLQMGKGRMETLMGFTYQQEHNDVLTVTRSGFTSTSALTSGGTAPSTTSIGNYMTYKYGALFGRWNLIWADRYVANFSWRRDGSSRFAPDHRMGNFWAVGGAWVLSEEPWLRGIEWLTFAKLRASYGITGNDQIGDYQYEQSYRLTSSANGYQGQQGVNPISFFNGKLGWELNHKLEVATDVQVLDNRLMVSASIYHNWTDNQLVYQTLPLQTGLPGVIANQQATVINEGIETSVKVTLGTVKGLLWLSTFSITLQRNYLKKFSALASTAYSDMLIIGKSLNVVNGFHFEGVDPQTGLSKFKDVNQNGMLDVQDRMAVGNLDMPAYGSWKNTLRYEGWELGVLFDIRLQHAANPLTTWFAQNLPGMAGPAGLGNMPAELLGRWQKPGDRTNIQRLTASPVSVAAGLIPYLLASDFSVMNASYARLKELSITRLLPEPWYKRLGFSKACVYIAAENILTITRYRGADPETRDPASLPTVRKIMFGIQFTF